MKITYQYTPKLCMELNSLTELIKNLPYKRYDKIYAHCGRGIILEVGDDKDFVVIPYGSRNRIVKYLNKIFCKGEQS